MGLLGVPSVRFTILYVINILIILRFDSPGVRSTIFYAVNILVIFRFDSPHGTARSTWC